MIDDARSSPNWPEPTEEVELLRKQLREETDRAENLMRALENARMIGTAMGIVLERQRVTSADAFEVLRRVSMNRNRKLHDVAREVVDTGVIPEAGTLRRVSADRGSGVPDCSGPSTTLPEAEPDSERLFDEGLFDAGWRPADGEG